MTYGERAQLARDIADAAYAFQQAEAKLEKIRTGPFKDQLLGLTEEFWLYQPDSRKYRHMAMAVEQLPVEQ